jgi:ribonuclease HI
MSGRRRNDEEESGGWASTFLKVAGSLYSEADVAPFGVKQTRLGEEVILYVDGSHFPRIPSAGCGGFLTDASGKWICGFALKLDSNLKLDEIEKEAILSGLRWVNKKGMRKVTVKSDREEAIKSVKSERRSNDARICEIRNLLNSPHWKATLTWIPGDDNKLADKLADEAHKLDHDQYEEFHDPPKMSGAGMRNDEKDTKEGEGAGGGWASTFFKVAGAVAATAAAAVAVAAVASSSQNVLKQPDATEVAPFQARRPDYLEEVVILNC